MAKILEIVGTLMRHLAAHDRVGMAQDALDLYKAIYAVADADQRPELAARARALGHADPLDDADFVPPGPGPRALDEFPVGDEP